MALDASEVVIAGSGHVYVADEGTAAPAAAIPFGAPGAGWRELGYTTDDGVTWARSRQSDGLPVWQSYQPVRTITTGADETISFVLRQFSPDNAIEALGGGTFVMGDTDTPGVLTLPDPSDVAVRTLLVDAIDGDNVFRTIWQRVQVGGDFETNFQSGDSMNLPIEFSGLAGTTNPVIQSDHPAWVA